MDDEYIQMRCPFEDGTLDGFVLKYGCHNWGFDIRTGENMDTGEYIDSSLFQGYHVWNTGI